MVLQHLSDGTPVDNACTVCQRRKTGDKKNYIYAGFLTSSVIFFKQRSAEHSENMCKLKAEYRGYGVTYIYYCLFDAIGTKLDKVHVFGIKSFVTCYNIHVPTIQQRYCNENMSIDIIYEAGI